MFVMSSGRIVTLEESDWAKAETRFFSELKANPHLACKYQILWLCTKYPRRVANELGGAYGGGTPVSVSEAASTLLALMGGEAKEVVVPPGFLPITEGLITFQPLEYLFLPRREPAIFNPANTSVTTMTKLVKEGRTEEQAVNKLLHLIRSA